MCGHLIGAEKQEATEATTDVLFARSGPPGAEFGASRRGKSATSEKSATRGDRPKGPTEAVVMAEESALDPKLAAGLASSVVERLEEWEESTGNRLSLEAWITSGNTPAAVAVVMVSGSRPPAKVIIAIPG